MTWQEEAAARQRQMEEQARAAEEGRRKNIALFERMWLGLGPDCIRAAGSQHRPEIDEALGLATSRWHHLHDLEAQVQREEQILATRPKSRPAAPGDELLPDRTIAQRDADWEVQTRDRRAGLAELKEQAKVERKLLESFRK
jgi:hypothetical protein